MKRNSLVWAVVSIGGTAALLLGLSGALFPLAQDNARAELDQMMARLLPGSTAFAQEDCSGRDDYVTAAYKAEGGYVVQTVTDGYAGDVELLVGVSNEGRVTGLVVRTMEETWGLGTNALGDMAFLSQFLHTTGTADVGETVDAMSGATVTSKAVARGVNAAVAYVTGVDIPSGATEWEG